MIYDLNDMAYLDNYLLDFVEKSPVGDFKRLVVLHKGQPTVPSPAGNWAPSGVTVASLNIDKMTFR